jgi:hypothetical protein
LELTRALSENAAVPESTPFVVEILTTWLLWSETHAFPDPSIAIPLGEESPMEVYPVVPERNVPALEISVTLASPPLEIQALPWPSMARLLGFAIPPPVKLRPIVKSFGGKVAVSAGANAMAGGGIP